MCNLLLSARNRVGVDLGTGGISMNSFSRTLGAKGYLLVNSRVRARRNVLKKEYKTSGHWSR